MFWDDVLLCQEAIERYGRPDPLYVEVGGSESPTIADYSRTIEAMKDAHEYREVRGYGPPAADEIREAQRARYLQIHRPLEKALPGYVTTDPAYGGITIEQLPEKYPGNIGVLVCLSVLEHCEEPWYAPEFLREAMRPGGLCIVSVPFVFPHHPTEPAFGDHWRFTPTGLRKLFESPKGAWTIEWCDWRLRIGADQGVRNILDGAPQAIESCAIVARAR